MNVQTLYGELKKLVHEVLLPTLPQGVTVFTDTATNRTYTEIIDQLLQRFPLRKLVVTATEMYFNPVKWRSSEGISSHSHSFFPIWYEARIALLLENLIAEHPGDDFHIHIEARLRQIWRHPYDSPEIPRVGMMFPPDYYLYPRIHDCLRLLTRLKPTVNNISLIKRILTGEFNFDQVEVPHPYYEERTAYEMYWVEGAFDDLLIYLYENNQLDYVLFRQAALLVPGILSIVTRAIHRQRSLAPSPACVAQLEAYHSQFLDEVIADLSPRNYRSVLKSCMEFSGSQYLLNAAHNHVRLKLKKLAFISAYDLPYSLQGAVIRLAQAKNVEPENPAECQAMIEQLRQFPATTLERLLPVATNGQHILCEALEWERALPLVQQLIRSAAQRPDDRGGYYALDAQNSPDPTVGVIEVAAVQQAIEQAGETIARKVLRLFDEARVGVSNTVMLFEAVKGWNRGTVEASFRKHTQIAIKAYGLLPLERGEAEVLERYLALRQSAKDGQKFGQMRRANQVAAVQVALANLAQIAGYANVTRMEMAMESKIAGEMASPDRAWKVESYDIQLTMRGVEAAISVTREGRALKTVPKVVRASSDYKKAKETLAQFRAQVKHLRSGVLEAAMAVGDRFTLDELIGFLAIPAARDMLSRLILQAENASMGLFSPDDMTLCDLNGDLHALNDAVRLVHPYHLFKGNQLSDWQRTIVHRRITQPFKQAFRELYLLTPAEQTTRTYSNRFAGHLVHAATAGKLFADRGWKIESGDIPTPYKVFSGLRAVFEFSDIDHYFGGDRPATADRIHFEAHPSASRNWHHREESWLPLEDVPPLIFSEVMRDADLIVSVAQRDGETRLSNEAYAQRGLLVQALLNDLELPGVAVDGHFAYVQGKLARYRVHLGSAVIHIEPGNYLCIVPDRWGKKHDKLFLPFADEHDSKISEVISKILLLLSDDRIKDESILHQIKRQV